MSETNDDQKCKDLPPKLKVRNKSITDIIKEAKNQWLNDFKIYNLELDGKKIIIGKNRIEHILKLDDKTATEVMMKLRAEHIPQYRPFLDKIITKTCCNELICWKTFDLGHAKYRYKLLCKKNRIIMIFGESGDKLVLITAYYIAGKNSKGIDRFLNEYNNSKDKLY